MRCGLAQQLGTAAVAIELRPAPDAGGLGFFGIYVRASRLAPNDCASLVMCVPVWHAGVMRAAAVRRTAETSSGGGGGIGGSGSGGFRNLGAVVTVVRAACALPVTASRRRRACIASVHGAARPCGVWWGAALARGSSKAAVGRTAGKNTQK
jgi:hypothetical protein